MRRFQVTPPPNRGSRTLVVGAPASTGNMLLGRLAEVGPVRWVRLDTDKEHVIAVVGKRGSGKTHTLGVLVEGLSAADSSGFLAVNNLDRGVLVFDTLNLFQWIGVSLESAAGDIARQQLERAKAWGLPPAKLNPRFWHLAGSSPTVSESKPFRVGVADMAPQDWGILMDVDTVGEPMGQLLVAACDKVSRTGWQIGTRRIGPVANHSIADLERCINEDSELSREFALDTRRAVRQRLAAYARTGLFSTRGTDLTDLMQRGVVSIILLARAGEDLRALVVFLIIRRLLEERSAASERTKDALIRGTAAKSQELPKSWVVIDEAQNIIPARMASVANRELTRFVREGRNFGLSMALSTQQPESIDAKVMAQVDVLISHTLTVRQDTTYVLANLKAPPPTTIQAGRREISMLEALRECEVGQCLVAAVDAPRAYFVEIRPRVTPHGGFEA